MEGRMYLAKFFFVVFLFSLLFISCSKNSKKNEAATATNKSTEKTVVQENHYENLLTATDVEKVSGLKGVKYIQRNPHIGAGGDINFAVNDKDVVVMIQIVNKDSYEGYKQFFKSGIKNLGDEAMQGGTLKGFPDNLVAFKKGDKCVALTVFIDKNDFSKNMLTIDQTIKLAKIIEAKI
jgi:hypothetical protein